MRCHLNWRRECVCHLHPPPPRGRLLPLPQPPPPARRQPLQPAHPLGPPAHRAAGQEGDLGVKQTDRLMLVVLVVMAVREDGWWDAEQEKALGNFTLTLTLVNMQRVITKAEMRCMASWKTGRVRNKKNNARGRKGLTGLALGLGRVRDIIGFVRNFQGRWQCRLVRYAHIVWVRAHTGRSRKKWTRRSADSSSTVVHNKIVATFFMRPKICANVAI